MIDNYKLKYIDQFNLTKFQNELNKIFGKPIKFTPVFQTIGVQARKLLEEQYPIMNNVAKINNQINILFLFCRYWPLEVKYLLPVLNIKHSKLPKQKGGHSNLLKYINSLPITSDVQQPSSILTDRISSIRNILWELIQRKLKTDLTTLCYGSFAINQLNSSIGFNDIDFFSPTAYRFMIVLLVLTEVVLGCSAEVIGIPYIPGHLSLKLNNQVSVCDCIYLPWDIGRDIPVIQINGYRILHPEEEMLKQLLVAITRTKTAETRNRYNIKFTELLKWYSPIQVINYVRPPVIKEFKEAFLHVELGFGPPLYIISPDKIKVKLPVSKLGIAATNLIKAACNGLQLTIQKMREYGTYFTPHVYEIRNPDLCGFIMAPFSYNLALYPDTKQVNISTKIAMASLLASLISQFRDPIYQNVYNSLKRSIEYNFNQKEEKLNFIVIPRYKPQGSHLHINFFGGKFNSLITATTPAGPPTQIYP